MFKREPQAIDKKSIIFMNTPIRTPSEDIIGFDTHVEKLETAINSDGQMIALTSPFGAGKTSIIELLQSKYASDKKKQVLKVSMWSHLCDPQGKDMKHEGDTTSLHSGFVYQLISQIDHKKGIYISKRMNPSYGLLRLHTEKPISWVFFIISLLLFFTFYVILDKFEIPIPFVGDALKIIALIGSALCFLVAVTTGEIVFSSNKSEGGRKIDTNEVMQLYRSVVLKHRRKPWHRKVRKFFAKLKIRPPMHYIIVVEDLDRTDDNAAVVNFLKELRKYYIPDAASNSDKRYVNKVTFLINVKPETLLCDKRREKEEYGHLYAKLFDYVLNLQTINIDDYETILERLLENNKEKIVAAGLSTGQRMLDIPGMRWMIHGRNLGLREIKDRLNIAFSLYESLKSKFPDAADGISFEKCAVVAYVITEFEEDFYATEDDTFQKLVEMYLKEEDDDTARDKLLAQTSSEYRVAIKELIYANLIDNNYRMYFYNYPKGSRIYTPDELAVQKAILYEYTAENLERSVQNVFRSNSDVVAESYKIREQLGLRLPDIVLKSEKLYVEAVKLIFDEVLSLLRSLDYSADATAKTISLISSILHFDSERAAYSRTHAAAYCEVFEDEFSETQLLQLRKMLCKEFPGEIKWYRSLFFGIHNIITQEEMNILPLCDAIDLINTDNEYFGSITVSYVTKRFVKEPEDETVSEHVLAFLYKVSIHFPGDEIFEDYFRYMSKDKYIVPEFEAKIMSVLKNGVTDETEPLFREYQKLINEVAPYGLLEQTLKNIFTCNKYDGYTYTVTEEMAEGGYLLDYTLQLLHLGEPIPFDHKNIADTIEHHIDWLLDNSDYFTQLRSMVADCSAKVLLQYRFMFSATCPVMTDTELETMSVNGIKDEDVISLLPPELITSDQVEMLRRYFCRTKQRSTQTYNILMFISKLDSSVASELFFALDFEAVKYRDMSAQRKADVKEAFKDILELDTDEGKVGFMYLTKCLDTSWETALQDNLKTDKALQEAYVKAVNSSHKTSRITIQNLYKMNSIYPMNEEIIDKFFEYKYYTQYVSCKTISRKVFEFEEDKLALLWPSYIFIFKSDAYTGTRAHMAKNQRFLEEIMQRKEYVGITNENVLPLAGILQNKECVEYIFGLDDALCEEYMTKILGFKDRDAAACFVESLENHLDILSSDDVYNNVHPKLVDGHLKGKYTRMRNKHAG